MAIYLYSGAAGGDYTNNGLCLLHPTSCIIRQEAGGQYILNLVHPVSGDNRWAMIREGCLIKAPTPQAETPNIEIYHAGIPATPGVPDRIIWRHKAGSETAYIYNKPYAQHGRRSLKKLKQGEEVEFLGNMGRGWSKAVSGSGITGYIYEPLFDEARVEYAIQPQPGSPGWSTVTKPRQVREQLFRVVSTQLNTVKAAPEISVYAQHVSYDLLKNLVTQYTGENVAVPVALAGIKDHLVTEYEGEMYTNLENQVTVDWQMKTGVYALLDPEEGLLYRANPQARLVRDNWDWFLLAPKVVNRGLTIRYGKNLKGIQYGLSAEQTATRIVPYGQDKDGKLLLLPEVSVDSAQISSYPVILTAPLEVAEAKEKDASGDDPGMTKAQCYELMRQRAQEAILNGTDGLDVTLDVDFIQLGDTVEYAQYKDLQQAFLYDTVTVTDNDVGFNTSAVVVAYEFDAVLERYQSVTLGRLGAVKKDGIAAFQLPSAGIPGTKLALDSISGSRLRDLSVASAKIGNAAITYAKIASATIDLLNADAITAVIAKINEVTAGTVTTNELYAKIIEAVAAEIDQVTAGTVTTNELYAQIVKATAAELGKVAAGTVTTNELYAAVIAAVSAELTHITAETVDTNALYAGLVQAMQADLGRITADTADISALYSALVNAVHIAARSADIDFLKVIDMMAGSAVFRMGTGGELYIDRLTVNEGNLVSLSAGKLMVKGVDGKWYTLQVGSDGITPIRVEEPVTDDNIGDGTLSGGKIMEGSINVDRLNAATIQGNQAFLVELTAGLGNFGTLFANEAIAEQLKTHLIHSDYLKVAIQSGENVAAYFEFLASGLRISAPGSQFYIQISNEEIGFFQSGVKVAWITGSMLHMPRAKIESELQIGQFSWVKESNGSLSLQYV